MRKKDHVNAYNSWYRKVHKKPEDLSVCQHTTLDHNGESYEKAQWICRKCGKAFTLAEFQQWMGK